MEYEKITKFTKTILDFMFFCGIVVLITVPVWMKLVEKYYSDVIKTHYWMMIIIFISAGVNGVIIIGELRKMMRTVLEQNCFVQNNVHSLRIMGKLSILISAVFCVKVFFVPTPATLIIILVFFIAALFSIVLSCVFQEAIDYKKENDLTI